MSRMDRLREYSNPLRGQQGAGRDQANIDKFSARAKTNSDGADHRASDGPIKLPDTGKMTVRDTGSRPYHPRNVDARMKAKEELNVAGDSPYLRGVRRGA